jgi:hypothetical protein
MTPGKVDGERFDGRMVSIVGNHVALVAQRQRRMVLPTYRGRVAK